MSRKKEKRLQRQKEDRAINALLWACVFAIIGSAGAVWYMIIRFMNNVDELTYYATSLMLK